MEQAENQSQSLVTDIVKLADVLLARITLVEFHSRGSEIPACLSNIAIVDGDESHTLEWNPSQGEEVIAQVENFNIMSMGGIALNLRVGEMRFLLKKGGRILRDKLKKVDMNVDDWLYIKYLGELSAKPGQSPARNWSLKKLLI